MRLLELTLERFGPFTDQSLAFDPTACLTVIYGPNEAGKSSALTALSDVLFGIPAQTPHAFLHPTTELRVGLRFQTRDGQVQQLWRRKGNKNTLTNASGELVSSEALASWVGVSRELFESAYGLDSVRLRLGATQLLEGAGQVGTSLLAAAPGLAPLLELAQRFEREADEQFVPRRKAGKAVHKALERWTDAKRAIESERLDSHELARTEQELARTTELHERLEGQRRTHRTERIALERQLALAPLLAELGNLDEQLARLAEVPELPPEFESERESTLRDCDNGRVRLEEARRGRLDVEKTLESLPLPGELLAAGDEIERLAVDAGATLKAEADLTRRTAECERLGRELDRLARELRLADRADLLTRPPTALERSELRRLAKEQAPLREAQRAADVQRREAGSQCERLSSQLTGLVCPVSEQDVAEVERRLHALLAETPKSRDVEPKQEELAQLERQLREQLGAMRPVAAELDWLRQAAVPSRAELDEWAPRWSDAEGQLQRERDKQQALVHQLERSRHELSALDGGAPPPTRDEVKQARAVRDDRWQQLKASAASGSTPLQPEDWRANADAFEASMRDLDALVERRDAAGQRLIQREHLLDTVEREQLWLRQASELREAKERALAELQREWQALWALCGIAPLGPAAMREWLLSRERCLLDAQRAQALATQLEQLRAEQERGVAELRTLAQTLAVPDAANLPKRDLVKTNQTAITERKASAARRRNLQEQLELRSGDQRSAERQWQEQASRLADWELAWNKVVPSLRLGAQLSPELADKALELWDQVAGELVKLRELEERISKMVGDAGRFRSELEQLESRLGTSAGAASEHARVQLLRQQLEAARSAQSERVRLLQQRCELTERERALREEHNVALANQQRLLELAGNCAPEQLAELGQQSSLRREHRRQHDKRSLALAGLADGRSLSALQAELAGIDVLSLRARLEDLRELESGQDDEIKRSLQAHHLAQQAWQQLRQRAGAEDSAQSAEEALTDFVQAGERWALSKTAARLLGFCLEAYRQRHQNPVLTRAERLFFDLSLGEFEALEVRLGERNERELLARRRGGQLVSVAGLSEGTRDQLYLALRAASIEYHAQQSEPLPLVCDDLLMTFDDERSAAALALLRELGKSTQTLLFTHHRRVVELASAQSGVQVLELGLQLQGSVGGGPAGHARRRKTKT